MQTFCQWVIILFFFVTYLCTVCSKINSNDKGRATFFIIYTVTHALLIATFYGAGAFTVLFGTDK